MIINLTPHPITLRAADGAETTITSSGVARVASTPGQVNNVDGVPVPVASPTTFGEIAGIPAEETAGMFYVVSGMVGAALRAGGSSRTDVLCPGTGPADGAVRNDAGHIIAVTRLVRP